MSEELSVKAVMSNVMDGVRPSRGFDAVKNKLFSNMKSSGIAKVITTNLNVDFYKGIGSVLGNPVKLTGMAANHAIDFVQRRSDIVDGVLGKMAEIFGKIVITIYEKAPAASKVFQLLVDALNKITSIVESVMEYLGPILHYLGKWVGRIIVLLIEGVPTAGAGAVPGLLSVLKTDALDFGKFAAKKLGGDVLSGATSKITGVVGEKAADVITGAVTKAVGGEPAVQPVDGPTRVVGLAAAGRPPVDVIQLYVNDRYADLAESGNYMWNRTPAGLLEALEDPVPWHDTRVACLLMLEDVEDLGKIMCGHPADAPCDAISALWRFVDEAFVGFGVESKHHPYDSDDAWRQRLMVEESSLVKRAVVLDAREWLIENY